MQKASYGVVTGSIVVGLAAAATLWVGGCGGGTGGTGVTPIPPGGGGGGGEETPPTVEAWQALFPPGQVGARTVDDATCNTEGCHASGAKHVRSFADTTHAKKGVGCQSCHGPGGNHVQAPSEENILGFPTTANVDSEGRVKLGILDPIVCGKCHSQVAGAGLDQYDEWVASKHVEVESHATFPDCENCHLDTARIVKAENKMSFHEGIDPVAITRHSASCAVCHDPHDTTAQDAQVRHKFFQSGTTDGEGGNIGPGATVATYTTFNHVCAECHNGRGVDASDAALQRSTSRPGSHHSNQFNMLIGQGGVDDTTTPGIPAPSKRQSAHARIEEQCVHCHMPGENHTMTAANQGCSPCHSASDVATLKLANGRSAIQSEIESKLLELRTALNNWGAANPIDGKGPLSWEYSAQGGPSSANQAKIPIEIKRARHNLYFVESDGSLGVHNIAYTRYLLDVAMQQVAAAPGVVGATSRSVSPSGKSGSTTAATSSTSAKGQKAQGWRSKLPRAFRK